MFPMRPNNSSIPGLLELSAGGGTVAAIYLRNPGAKITLLYSHGNGENLESIYRQLKQCRRAGYAVLAYDHPGYGRSSGASSDAGTFNAIDSCYRFLVSEGVNVSPIVLYGRSLGSGPSVDLATREQVGGPVLERGFVSAFRVMTRRRVLSWDKFENERKLKRIRQPAFVMQAARDEVAGYWQAPCWPQPQRAQRHFGESKEPVTMT